MRIDLTDNNIRCAPDATFDRKEVGPLFDIGGRTVAELCQSHDNLLIFPYSLGDMSDGIADARVLDILNTMNPEKVVLRTGNIMGFIGKGGVQMHIKSRFDAGREDYLLHYMLHRVLSLNLFDLNHGSDYEDIFDLLVFMFPYFLKEAMIKGMYRDYRSLCHNDAHVRGPVDIARHVTRNVPFRGNVAYSTREYSQDNAMTQLIRHTIEVIAGRSYGQWVLYSDTTTTDNVKAIRSVTPDYQKGERRKVISRNLRMQVHPFYTEYRPLQTLCMQILSMEEVKYGEADNEICGILFDGAWLWEEYVATVLHGLGFKHPENKNQIGGVPLFEDGSGIRYPDFYNRDMVLDAKYKRIGSYARVSKVDRDDVHQLMAYMTALGVNKGGFIAPLTDKQIRIPTATIKNGGGRLSIYGIEIARAAESYRDFCRRMQEAEREFVRSLIHREA